MFDTRRIAKATRCLWSLQEVVSEIEGLLITHSDGITLTSTLRNVDSIQRLSAVSNTLFMLCEDVSDTWGRGQASEVRLRIVSEDEDDHPVHYYVSLKPVSSDDVLVALYRANDNIQLIDADIDLAVDYLSQLLNGDDPPPISGWHSQL